VLDLVEKRPLTLMLLISSILSYALYNPVLTEEAEKLDIPFQFNPMLSKFENLDFYKLRVKNGEARAISSILQLHSLLALDEDASRRKSSLLSKNSNAIHL